MNVPEQVAQLCQALPLDKQVEVLDFVEFLVSRQSHPTWTVEQRREVVARTMGCLREIRTSSEAFAQRNRKKKPSRNAGGKRSGHPLPRCLCGDCLLASRARGGSAQSAH
jgi:hypothetical protein